MKSVLVVDDADLIRRLIRSTLGSKKFDCVDAKDGKMALAKVFETKFDLIISDLNMPILNGLEFIQQIRKQLPDFNTPIIMLTSDSNLEQVRMAKTLGIKCWIIKPFTSEMLLKAVNGLLNLNEKD